MDVPADGLQFRLKDRSGVELGDAVTVELGHDGEQPKVFRGTVVALRPAIVGVEIRALGTMNALLNYRMAALYENQSVGSIANDLISQSGLSAGTVDSGPTLPRFAINSQSSAFVHLKGLADRIGCELYANRDGDIMFHALGKAANAGAGGLLGAAGGLSAAGGSEEYVFGKHLLDASVERQPAIWDMIETGSESPVSGQGQTTTHWLTTNDADYKGSAGSGARRLLVFDAAARTKDLADNFAAGRLAVAERRAHEILLMVLGRPSVDLGDSITTSEVPDSLINGSGYVRAICHRFDTDKGFLTDLRIGLGAT